MFLRTWIGLIADAVFTVILFAGLMYVASPTMSLMAMIPISLVFLSSNRQAVLTRPTLKRMQIIMGKLGAYVQQNIIGMKVVRIFQKENEMDEGFNQVEDIYANNAIFVSKILSGGTPSKGRNDYLPAQSPYYDSCRSLAFLLMSITQCSHVLSQ
jgi:ABC-type multidrug transport system fused ATPase/permease subunit